MTTKPARDYFDRPCESHEEFKQIKAELESQGFRDVGNSNTDEGCYQQHIWMEDVFSRHDIRMTEARKQHYFANQVEERTWDYKDRGFQVVRTQGFATDGKSLDDYVAFFIK